jgi:hypothetical protein
LARPAYLIVAKQGPLSSRQTNSLHWFYGLFQSAGFDRAGASCVKTTANFRNVVRGDCSRWCSDALSPILAETLNSALGDDITAYIRAMNVIEKEW